MNWRLGLLILLGVAIVVVLVIFRKRVFEGFQPTTTGTTPVLELYTGIVNNAVIGNRFGITPGVGNVAALPVGIRDLTGKVSKADAYTVCARLGGTMARIDDVRRHKNDGGSNFSEVGWVDDLDTPINLLNVSLDYQHKSGGSKTDNAGQVTDTTAFPICIGPTETPQTGWNLVPSTEAELPSLVNGAVTDTQQSITIFDPTAAYVQADIAALEYPIMMQQIHNTDLTGDIFNNSSTKDTAISQYYWWMKNYSKYSSSIYFWSRWIYKRRYTRLEQIEAGYWNEYLADLQKYATSAANIFKSHPIAYIMKEYEKIKTAEYIEYINNPKPVIEDIPPNDRGQPSVAADDGYCERNKPTGTSKTRMIDFSDMPDAYPKPGYLCIPKFLKFSEVEDTRFRADGGYLTYDNQYNSWVPGNYIYCNVIGDYTGSLPGENIGS